MKASKLLLFMAIFGILTLSSCATDAIDQDEINVISVPHIPQAKQIEIEILELINAHRINKGLSVLDAHNTVKAVAFTHTDYMILSNEVSHDNFFERKLSLETNANADIVSENVAYGFNSADAVVKAWLNSESHKENIEGDYTNFDVSAEQNNEGKWYFTNIFIKR